MLGETLDVCLQADCLKIQHDAEAATGEHVTVNGFEFLPPSYLAKHFLEPRPEVVLSLAAMLPADARNDPPVVVLLKALHTPAVAHRQVPDAHKAQNSGLAHLLREVRVCDTTPLLAVQCNCLQ